MIEDKDLIALAQAIDSNAADDPYKDMHPDVVSFCIESGIQEDPKGCVDLKHIHWAYVKWAQFKDLPVMHQREFGKHLHKKFKKRKSFRRITYFVNKEPFQMDTNEIWIMGAYYREQNKYGQKKANKRKASRAAKAVQQ